MELTSGRLVLRPADAADLDFYVELRNHPELLAPQRREPRPRGELERELREWIELWHEQGFGPWTVFDRETTERLGRVELDSIGPGWPEIAPDEIEVGCIVHPAHWNRGIATEATQLAVEQFFSRADRRRLVALTTADNHASLRALEKLRMRSCGEAHLEGDETT
ncbi:MAG: GNAT family N-acetyltransferase, partial [Gaiellaceae bacterium]